MKTTVGRVRDGVQKPPWDGCTMVYENHNWAGERWCTKTAVGWVRWCTKTTVGRVRDDVQKPPWDGARWCTKTAMRWVGDGV